MKVLIADDQAGIRATLRFALECEDGFEVVGSTSNGSEVMSAGGGDADSVLDKTRDLAEFVDQIAELSSRKPPDRPPHLARAS